jgi:CRISPR-associated endonuclease/helicase Cas3
MNANEPLGVEDFAPFFRAVYGVEPFPWQARLAREVCTRGWPQTLDVPTGVGKTAAIDVAVFHLAARPAQAPRRVVFLVDRRLVVDQAHERAAHLAQKLQEALRGAGEPALQKVARALGGLSRAGSPLETAVLRGGMVREDRWASDPSQPLVVASTVDQVGSRLLFRGYGVSDGMKPVHAGLLGNDALFLLDEVHLAEPFRQTLEQVRRYRGWRDTSLPLPDRWGVVQMSATPGPRALEGQVFRLDDKDKRDPALSPRLRAPRPARLRLVEPPKQATEDAARDALAQACAQEAQDLHHREERPVVGVVVNRVDVARRVYEALRASQEGREAPVPVFLLTGRMRALDRLGLLTQPQPSLAQASLLGVVSSRLGAQPTRPGLFLVATQCIEAGADFDLDALVTECASLDALRQRFGRLNRLGQNPHARAAILARKDQVPKSDKDSPTDPIYGEALGEAWRWLSEELRRPIPQGAPQEAKLARQMELFAPPPKQPVAVAPLSIEGGPWLDLGLEAVEPRLASLEADPARFARLLSPRAEAPVLLPSYMDAWAQTAPRPAWEAEPALFLHGKRAKQAPEVQLVWRADLRPEWLKAGDDPEQEAKLCARLMACLPSSLEALSVPFYEARAWLQRASAEGGGAVEAPASPLGDVEGGFGADDAEARPSRRGGAGASDPWCAVLWRGEESCLLRLSDLNTEMLVPSDTLVVPAAWGGIGRHLTWDPQSVAPVGDLAHEAQVLHRRRPVLRLDDALLSTWFTGAPPVEAWKELAPELHARMEPDPAPEALAVSQAEALRLFRANLRAHKDNLRAWLRWTVERWEPGWDLVRVPHPSVEGEASDAPQESLVLVARKPWKAEEGPAEPMHLLGRSQGDDFGGGSDGSAMTGRRVTLEEHCQGVRAVAQSLAEKCGLEASLAQDVALAALLHDMGKLDPRFQRMLNLGLDPEVPLAKSGMGSYDRATHEELRRRSGYPKGARHELLSVALLENNPGFLERAHDPELVLHLIASHHGHARPFAPAVPDPEACPLAPFELGGVRVSGSTAHRLDALSSPLGERFWSLVRRYGWFHLAWLESLLRLSDHARSAEEREPGRVGGA